MDITCIGHITRDKIVTPQLTTYLAGGTTTYVALGLNALLRESTQQQRDLVGFRLVASLADEDLGIVDEMRQKGIRVDVIRSRQTSYFENIYGDNSNDRRQNVRGIGDPFSIDCLRPIIEQLHGPRDNHYIILGSLLAHDFSLDVVRYCRQHGKVVMDAQGYFREVRLMTDEQGQLIGKIHECDWTQKASFLANIDVLKLNENEARLITDLTDLHEAARHLHAQGVTEVLLTLGRDGSIVAANGEIIDIPAVPETRTVDATGCGDTYVMAYIYRRSMGDTPRDAARFASSAATFKLEGTGPLSATEAEVRARMI